MNIRLVVTGRMYHMAAELPERFDLHDEATLTDALEWVKKTASEAPLAASCLVAVNGEHQGTLGDCRCRPLKDGDELTLIAPVAGG